MNIASITLIGASGYAGLEATKLIARHPRLVLKHVVSASAAGLRVAQQQPGLGPVGELRYAPLHAAVAVAAQTDIVVLATSVETSLGLVPQLLQQGCRVLDMSGAYRLLDASIFAEAYGCTHTSPQYLPQAVYGLPELHADAIAGAKLVANPGCYPTATILALAPLLRCGLLAPGGIVVNGVSGVTGAGRSPQPKLMYANVAENFAAYRPLVHQHAPEMMQALQACANRPVPITFVPHLLPVRRGLHISAYARLAPKASLAQLQDALKDAYAAFPDIFIASSPADVQLASVVGSNRLHLGVAVDARGYDAGRVVVAAAIDNLRKGAASQALQNLNVMLGWPLGLGVSPTYGVQ